MGETTKIGWTGRMVADPVTGTASYADGATWNPWIGCTHASEGCVNCYAEDMMAARYGRVVWGNAANSTRVRTSPDYWAKLIAWDKKAKATGIWRRVFIASLADVFEQRIELVPWRKTMFDMLTHTRNLQILMLTKRIELVPDMMVEATGKSADEWFAENPHVCLGTSVENQKWADARIPEIGKVKASMRFLSVEPMIGPIDVRAYKGMFDWLIIGGESGTEGPKHKIRGLKLEDAESLIEQGKGMGVPVYFKQTGTVLARQLGLAHKKGEDFDEWPESLQVREWPN